MLPATSAEKLARSISNLLHASVTKLGIRLRELEGTAEQPDTPLASRLVWPRETTSRYDDLLDLDLDDTDDLLILHDKLEKLQFKCSHKARKLLDPEPHLLWMARESGSPNLMCLYSTTTFSIGSNFGSNFL